MSDLQAIADRVEIEALRGEYTDAVIMHDRLESTEDGAEGSAGSSTESEAA